MTLASHAVSAIISRCAIIGVDREEQGEEHTSLGSFSTVGQGTGCDFPQPHLLVLPACQET